MKTTGESSIPKFLFLVFLGHPSADVETGGVCDKYEKDKNTRSVRRHLSAVRLCFTSRQVTSTTTLSPSMVASTILSTSLLLITRLLLHTSV